MKLRIEEDELGRVIIVLPDDLVEEFMLEEGDLLHADFPDEGMMEIHFPE